MRRTTLLLVLGLAACSGGSSDSVFQGYVEGDFIAVAPEVGGRIVELAARRGTRVEEGALLFRLGDQEAKASADQAQAELARAKAELENLRQGQRPPEIAVKDAQIAEASAALDTARKDYERQSALFDRRVISEAQLDRAREAITVAEARLTSAERQKDVAEMPARTPQIEAAERAVQAAEAALVQALTRLAKHVVKAPAAGRVEDVYYEAGEVAGAGAPVLSLLPNERRKVVFFVPEAARPALAIGSEATIACDGCPEGITAEVTFLGIEAEFTPPVIFSRETRDKLVFRAEARLDSAAALPLGQPVDVSVAAGLMR